MIRVGDAEHDKYDNHEPEAKSDFPGLLDCDTVTSINDLHACSQNICGRGMEGINSDFSIIPALHPHAQLAWEVTPPVSFNSTIWHVFSDGSAKHDRATWAIVILQEMGQGNKVSFARVGYAAGNVNHELGMADQTAMDAEATAIIAIAEFALANCTARKAEVFCHFDAWTVGFGATGECAIPQQHGSISQRTKAARVIMVEKAAESRQGFCGGLHVCAHQGHPWNEMADSIAKEAWKGWEPPVCFNFRAGGTNG